MAILTQEQKEKYLNDGFAHCPFCGSEDISGHSVDVESNVAWQNVDCQECGESWRDVYHLAEVETDDELDAEIVSALKPEVQS